MIYISYYILFHMFLFFIPVGFLMFIIWEIIGNSTNRFKERVS